MIRWLFRQLRRVVSILLLALILLLLPVGYVEFACRESDPSGGEWDAASALAPAYDEVAQGYAGGAPHQTRFAGLTLGHWSGLCAAAGTAPEALAARVPGYGDAMYLTADLILRGAYEETIGRGYVIWRGDEPAPLDAVAARNMAGFAGFVASAPWYDWDFAAEAAALTEARTEAQRDWERWVGRGAGAWSREALAWTVRQALRLRAAATSG